MAEPGKRFSLPNFVLALSVGSLGGTVFFVLGMPLPWILGAMSFCLFAALARLPVMIPFKARPPMLVVVGVMLGSSYTTDMLRSLPEWIVPALGLIVFLFVAAAVCVTYFVVVAKYDFRTAYFSGMPGGLMEMVTLSDHYGADTRRVALVHSGRILIVVFALPFLIGVIGGVDVAQRSSVAVSILDLTPGALVWFVAIGVLGAGLGHIIRLPAKYMLGPMLLSAVVHAAGLTDFKVPNEMVVIAQIVIGASVGCRFTGLAVREILTILWLSLGSSVLLLGVTGLFSYGISLISPFSIIDLLLAYSPGGLAEMGLIALALNIEIAFVTSHHLFRVFLVGVGAAIGAKVQGGFSKPES